MKNTNFQKLIVVWAVMILTAGASGWTIYVDPNGTGDYPTIRDAVNAAGDGYEVVLADGTYKLQGLGYIRIDRKITVRSENGPENCIIDCNGSAQEHRGAFRVSSDATIAGITIINGYEYRGGAVLCGYGNSSDPNAPFDEGSVILSECCDYRPKIINCVLKNNFSWGQGGAISSRNSNLIIINCKITNNSALMGGGIYCEEGQLYVDKCIISDNTAVENTRWTGGGGICCSYGNSLMVIDSRIINNIAKSNSESKGGAILCYEPGNLTILNSVISGNICQALQRAEGGGIYYKSQSYHGNKCIIAESVIKENSAFIESGKYTYGGGMYFYIGSQPIITKCVISGNSAVIGAGICFIGCYSTLDNSIITGNSHLLKTKYPYNQAGGIYCDRSYMDVINCLIVGNSGFGIHCSSRSINIANSIIYDNKYGEDSEDQIIDPGHVTVSYSYIQMNEPNSPPWPGIGNINADPCFIDAGYWDTNGTPDDYWDDFWIDGDYHLKPASPCIDSGGSVPLMLSDTDLDNKPRIADSAVDMGAYENRLPAIEVKLFCIPRSLNVHSYHKTIIALLTMPEDIEPDDIDPNEPLFFEPCRVKSKRQIVYQKNWHGKSRTCVLAVFNLADCMEKFSNGPNKVTVKSRLKTGRRYYGTDTIRLVSWKWFSR